MSDVKKWYIGVYGGDAQARPCSPAEFEIIHASEGRYFVLAEDYDSAAQCFITAAEGCVAAERRERALQHRLTASDERADVLEGLLLQTNELLYAIQGDPGAVPSSSIDAMRGEVFTALKPADGSKPSTCTWSEGGFSWHTGCGKEWQFTDGGLPSENGMHFCHSCGKTLVVEEAGAETEKDNDWRMNPCKQGHRDVGAAGGVAACNECDEKIEAPTTQEAFERWNATHPKL